MFTITSQEDNMKIVFANNGTNLIIKFQKIQFEAQKFVAFKGLIHSRPISDYQAELILDQEGLLSLVYQDGNIHFRMGRGNSILVLPINREAYNHLDYLINHWI